MKWVVNCRVHATTAAVYNAGVRSTHASAIAFLAADGTPNGKPEASLMSRIQACTMSFVIVSCIVGELNFMGLSIPLCVCAN